MAKKLSKIRVIANWDILKEIKDFGKPRSYSQNMGKMLVREIKSRVRKGISPIKKQGRFEAYAAQRDERGKYPDGIIGKRRRPVNLKLSGRMLRALTFKARKGKVQVGIFSGVEKRRAEAHNFGTLEHKNVPRRTFIPRRGTRDEFVDPILAKIKQAVEEEFNRIIKKSSKKKSKRTR